MLYKTMGKAFDFKGFQNSMKINSVEAKKSLHFYMEPRFSRTCFRLNM